MKTCITSRSNFPSELRFAAHVRDTLQSKEESDAFMLLNTLGSTANAFKSICTCVSVQVQQ